MNSLHDYGRKAWLDLTTSILLTGLYASLLTTKLKLVCIFWRARRLIARSDDTQAVTRRGKA